MAVGPTIRERRRALGISQERLARDAGLTWSAVQRLEAGKTTDPHYSTLSGIAHVLGTTVAELVGEEQLAVPLAGAPKDEALQDSGPHIPVAIHDKVGVSDAVKARLEEKYNALIYEFEALGNNKRAAELVRMRDEDLAA